MVGWALSIAKSSSALLLALVSLAAMGQAHARQFQSSDVEAADHPVVRATAYMDELLRQRSNNRLGINLGATRTPRSSRSPSCARERSTWRGWA